MGRSLSANALPTTALERAEVGQKLLVEVAKGDLGTHYLLLVLAARALLLHQPGTNGVVQGLIEAAVGARAELDAFSIALGAAGATAREVRIIRSIGVGVTYRPC